MVFLVEAGGNAPRGTLLENSNMLHVEQFSKVGDMFHVEHSQKYHFVVHISLKFGIIFHFMYFIDYCLPLTYFLVP